MLVESSIHLTTIVIDTNLYENTNKNNSKMLILYWWLLSVTMPITIKAPLDHLKTKTMTYILQVHGVYLQTRAMSMLEAWKLDIHKN